MNAGGRGPIVGVYLSGTLDLAAYFDPVFAEHAPDIVMLRPETVSDPATVQVAMAWQPSPDAFSRYPNLRLVSSIAAGVDSILSCPSLPPGVPVMRIRDEDQARTMAGFAAWHVLWHHRRFSTYLQQQRFGIWQKLPCAAPREVRVGILGFGQMGRAVAEALVVLGYCVAAFCRREPAQPIPGVALHSGAEGLGAIATQSDILINLLPLTPETRGLLDARLFARMPRGAALIQLGRGEQLVEEDLLAALAEGRLSGASLDVFAAEPLPASHPFWTHPNVVVTPHAASESSAETVVRFFAEEVRRCLAGGSPAAAVDRTNGY